MRDKTHSEIVREIENEFNRQGGIKVLHVLAVGPDGSTSVVLSRWKETERGTEYSVHLYTSRGGLFQGFYSTDYSKVSHEFLRLTINRLGLSLADHAVLDRIF